MNDNSASLPADPKNLLEVPLADLVRVTPFKGRNDIRYYLNGVLVTPYDGHALLVATNGHWLAIYESFDAWVDRPRILDMPDWFVSQIERVQGGHPVSFTDEEGDDWEIDDLPSYSPAAKTLVLADEKSRLTLREPAAEVMVKPGLPFIDGKFPNWRKALPDPSMLERGIFAPVATGYLTGLRRAVPDEREHPLFCYHSRATPDKTAILFRFGNLPRLVVALMPRRDRDTEPTNWPQWMQPEPEQEAQAHG